VSDALSYVKRMISHWERNHTMKAAPAAPAEKSATRAELVHSDDVDEDDEYSDYDFDPIYYN
jgi:hypothetical protein